MVHAKATGPIDKIHKRPTFSTLCHIQRHIVKGLRKLGNDKFPLDEHAGYILSKEAFAFFMSK